MWAGNPGVCELQHAISKRRISGARQIISSHVFGSSGVSADLMMKRLRCIVAAVVLSSIASEQVPTWCGKPYEAGSPHITIPVEARFAYSAKSLSLLLHFQCNPVVRPYISNEDEVGGIILDAEISYDVGQPFKGELASHLVLHVSVVRY